jgi:hypothetical protein
MVMIQYVEVEHSVAPGRRNAGVYLFQRYNLHASLMTQQQLINAEIDQYDPNELTETDAEKIAAFLKVKYLVEGATLREEDISVEDHPTKIDVRNDGYRDIYDRDRPTLVDGVELRVHIPVEGDPSLLESSPPVRYMDGSTAPGRVVGRDVVLSYRGTELRPEHVRSHIDRDLEQIRRRLGAVNSRLDEWNAAMREHMRERITARRKRLGSFKRALGYPLRTRAEPVEGYDRNAVVRRAIGPAVSRGEPFLEMAHYEDILSVLSRVPSVMERAPSAFATMDEEAIHHQFLVPLNVLYEGQAHAEACNFEGRADILIRVGGRALFIAECKFWKGAKSLSEAVDQLLGYTTWRDTKIALLIFNRGQRFSSVLAKIALVIEQHPAFVRRLPYKSESGSRYVLRRPDDEDRELILTALAFDVPSGP